MNKKIIIYLIVTVLASSLGYVTKNKETCSYTIEYNSTSNIEKSQKEYIVYRTKYGKKYHKFGCGYLRLSCIPISLNQAEEINLTPCSVCNP